MTKPWRSESSNSNCHSAWRRDASGRVVGRADVEQLGARPHVVGHVAPRGREAASGIGIHAVGFGAGEQRGALVDLVERIRHDHGRAGPAAVDDGLGEREQRLAAAENGQHLRRRRRWSRDRAGVRATRRSLRAARARRSSWDNATAPSHPPRSASSMNGGVGCFGSPIERLIGASAGLGVTSANHCRNRSNGYGFRRDRRGFNGGRQRGTDGAIIRERSHRFAALPGTAAANGVESRVTVASARNLPATGFEPAAPTPWRWRLAQVLALLAAGALLALVVAHWGWRWFGPQPPVPAPAPSAAPVAESIIAAAPFGRAAARNASPSGATSSATAAFPADARLLGVFAGANGDGYALLRFPDRGAVLVKSGQEIATGVQLEAVRPDGIRIRDRGEVRDIPLRQGARPPIAPAPTAPATGHRARRAAAYRLRATRGLFRPRLSAQRGASGRHGRAAAKLDRRCSRRRTAISSCATKPGSRRCSA